MVAPAAFVQHLKDLAQRLVADLAHAFRRQFEAVTRADDVALFFEHLLDAFEIFQVLVGFFAKQLANLLEIELGRIAHAALAPAEKTLQAAQLPEDLTRFTHAHALGALKRVLIHELFQLLHLAHHVAQLLQLFLGHGVEIFQHVVEIVDGRVQHVGQVLEKVLVLQKLVHSIEHVHQALIVLSRQVLALLLHAAIGDLVLQPVSQFLIALISLLHPALHLVHVAGVLAGETLHEIPHLLVIGLEFFRQAAEFVAEGFSSSGVSLKESGEYFLSISRRFSSASRRKSRMPLTERSPSSEVKPRRMRSRRARRTPSSSKRLSERCLRRSSVVGKSTSCVPSHWV